MERQLATDRAGKISQEKRVKLYIGSTEGGAFSRDASIIQELLQHSLPLDNLLADISKTIPPDQPFNLLDLGSGSGGFLKDLTNINHLPKFSVRLRQNIFRLRAIGLTDAQTPETFDTPDEEFEKLTDVSLPINGDHKIQNYFYTLTAAQTLEQFLKNRQLTPLNFVLACQSLIYLSPRIVKDCLETIANTLAPGGKALIAGIHTALPAFEDLVAMTLKGELTSQDVDVINRFYRASGTIIGPAQLYVSPEWPQLMAAGRRAVHKLLRWNPNLYNQVNSKEIERFRHYVSDLNKPIPSETEATEFLSHLSVIRHAVDEIRNKQTHNVAEQKEAVIQNLDHREDIQLERLEAKNFKRDLPESSAFLIHKL